MVIRDLFSHKIHSSDDLWASKLVDLAFVFSEFDRTPFDRDLLEERLSKISPRASTVSRDPSKFRDEISAYPAYLGLYRLALINGVWHFVLSETARKYLVTDEPNVPAFMLLQLLLFQYPNGMGVAYSSRSGNVRIQANTRDRTLEFIENSIHLSPLRLICKAIKAVSVLESSSIFDVRVSYDEIFALANDARINVFSNPPLKGVIEVLRDFREEKVFPPEKYESRFHILKHTNFLVSEKSGIRLRDPLSNLDKVELNEKFDVVSGVDLAFRGFDEAKNSNDILNCIIDGSWGRYFDGVKTLSSDVVEKLTSEKGVFDGTETGNENLVDPKHNFTPPLTYTFRKRNQAEVSYSDFFSYGRKIDPEVTRIRRQKSNLEHKTILQKLEEYLESMGCSPVESDHIDLFAKIPGDGKFLFEVKSISENNLLSQARKGVSQLYEYRYRYQANIGYDVSLCLVLPRKPEEIEWLEDYLCRDRKIGLIWFDEDGMIRFPDQSRSLIASLLH